MWAGTAGAGPLKCHQPWNINTNTPIHADAQRIVHRHVQIFPEVSKPISFATYGTGVKLMHAKAAQSRTVLGACGGLAVISVNIHLFLSFFCGAKPQSCHITPLKPPCIDQTVRLRGAIALSLDHYISSKRRLTDDRHHGVGLNNLGEKRKRVFYVHFKDGVLGYVTSLNHLYLIIANR